MQPSPGEAAGRIIWPEGFAPAVAPVHVRNELIIAAPRELTWAWLVRATRWPSWYPNCANVKLLAPARDDLGAGVKFTWKTFGVSLTSEVLEWVPQQRLAWNARGSGVFAYHAWLLEDAPGGCRVLTEETQHGWACWLGALVFPQRMSQQHQIWLEQLAKQAASGAP